MVSRVGNLVVNTGQVQNSTGVIGNNYESSNGDAKMDAGAYIRLMEDTLFVVSITVTQSVLSHLGPETKGLQAIHCNLANAYGYVVLRMYKGQT